MWKKILALFLTLTILFGMSSVTYASSTEDTDSSVNVTLSISQGSKFYTSKTKDIMMLQEMTVPYFDLDLYGLSDFYYNPDCYTGETQKAGTKDTAEGNVTLLHAIIFATEIYELKLPEDEAGLGTLYDSGKMSEYLNIGGTVGSSFISDFWGLGYNLNYYVNYEFPLGKEGWGASADQILLKEGDHLSIHNIESEDETITGSSFAYFTVENEVNYATVKQGESVILNLKYTTPGDNYVTTSVNGAGIKVYYTSSPAESPASWTSIGTTDSLGNITIDTSNLAAGTYYVGTDSAEADFFSNLEHAPGVMKLTITENDSDIVYGDANGDDVINSADAALVLRYAANKISDSDMNTAATDVNGDGTINSADAALILRYAANKITEFPVESSN